MSLSGITGSLSGGLFNCGCFARGANLVVAGQTYLADFHGNIKFQLDPNKLTQFLSGGVSLVPLQLQEFVSDGIGNLIGPVTIRKDPNRNSAQSTLKAIASGKPFPAIHDTPINIHVTIPNLLPGITLRSRFTPNPGPPILRNSNVTNFPPQNDVYQLVEPIELEDVNNPGPVLATIQTFPVTVNPATP